MRVKFVAPARREFLKEVVYYNEQEPGLGTAFAQEVEEAAARALAFPDAGSLASKNTKRAFVNRFPFSVVYRAQIRKALSSSRWPTIRDALSIGYPVYKGANRLFEPTPGSTAALGEIFGAGVAQKVVR